MRNDNPSSFGKPVTAENGVALVLVLAFLVLLTGLVSVFFIRAVTERQISDSSSNQAKSDLLARSALEIVVGDLKQEIQTNSVVSTSSGIAIYSPKSAADIVPQRLGTTNTLPNLVRRSFSGDTVSKAGNAPSTTASVNGRSISTDRWNAHYLLPKLTTSNQTSATPIADFIAPDWVMVTRGGVSNTATVDEMKDNKITNNNYAVGRYASAVYDEGGLLDMNVAGYPTGLNASQIGGKGVTALADLTQIGLTQGQIDNIVGWRNFATAQPGGFFNNTDSSFTFNPAKATTWLNEFVTKNKTGFTQVSDVTVGGRTDQVFLSRQQLIKMSASLGLDVNALQYLGTFNREKNAPSWSPSLDAAAPYTYKANADLDASVNRNLANVRVTKEFTRLDGSQAILGEPLLKKRFPLSRLALVTQTATETGSGDIYKYFGLKRSNASQNWTYDHGGTTGAISTLAQVAQSGREPDMVELLQATILNGSLGKTGGNTSAQTSAPDSNTYYQIIRIAANIIDQYDADSIPTTITFDGQDFYGIESLPYINQIFVLIAKNTVKTPKPIDNFQLYPYVAFQLWNPHDVALSGPSTASPSAIRIRPLAGGSMYVRGGQDPAPPSTNGKLVFDGTSSISIPAADFSNYAQPQIPATDFVGPIFNVSAFSLRLASQPLHDQSFAWLWCEISSSTVFALEYQDASGWHPYSTFAGLVTLPAVTGLLNDPGASAANLSLPYPLLYAFGADQAVKAPVTPPARAITTNATWYNSIIKSDPRTSRFGASFSAQIKPAGQPSAPAGYLLDGKQNSAIRPSSSTSVNGGNGYWAANGRPNWSSATVAYPGLLAQNTAAGQQYADRDGVFRPGDGAVNPTGPVNPLFDPTLSPSNEDQASRPIILNRPFRSVGELAFVYRDQPWKSLDFSSASSADAGLLDVFSVDESDMTAARVSLNTRQAPVLAAIISGAFKTDLATPVANATEIATAMLSYRNANIMQNRSDIAKAIASIVLSNSSENKVKTQREAAARALSENTTTRTWNLLIDVIAQSGRFSPNATNLSQFNVEGEKRYWLHVAIDRFTGEIIDKQLEPVYE